MGSPFFRRFLLWRFLVGLFPPLSTLFQPRDHCGPRHAKGPGQPSQAAPLVIGPQDLGLSLRGVGVAARLLPALTPTLVASIHLFAIVSVTVLDELVTPAVAT